MTTKTIKPGDKIHYSGDMANNRGWFVVKSVSGQYANLSEIVSHDGDNPREFGGVFLRGIGDKYEGHCNPRFVTEEAYEAWKQARMAAHA